MRSAFFSSHIIEESNYQDNTSNLRGNLNDLPEVFFGFLTCDQDGFMIKVSPSINKPLEDFTLMNKDLLLRTMKSLKSLILIPEGLSVDQEKELQNFEQFVKDDHKIFFFYRGIVPPTKNI